MKDIVKCIRKYREIHQMNSSVNVEVPISVGIYTTEVSDSL